MLRSQSPQSLKSYAPWSRDRSFTGKANASVNSLEEVSVVTHSVGLPQEVLVGKVLRHA